MVAGLELIISLLGLSIGFITLNEGAKLITDNAVVVAKKTGYSRVVIGILVVSVLAAMPEILISMFAMGKQSPALALGNALGSHIVNISFIIGLWAFLLMPLLVTRELIVRDAVFLLIITLVGTALLADNDLTRLEGIALILLFVPYAINLLIIERSRTPKKLKLELHEIRIELEFIGQLARRKITVRAGGLWLFFGIFIAVISAYWVTESALHIAAQFGVSEYLLGVSVVALGSSLPDILAAYHATCRKHTDLALAIGIGANIFTWLLTLGIMGMVFSINDIRLPELVPIMIGANIVIFALLIFMVRGLCVSRGEGAALVGIYLGTLLATILLKTL